MRKPQPNAVAMLLTCIVCVAIAVRPLAEHHHHTLTQVILAGIVILIAIIVMVLFLAVLINRGK